MAKQLKLRRGTTSQHSSFTGAEGEVTVDTTKDTLVVHDGSTAGGIPLAKESDIPSTYIHPNHSGEVTSTGDGATVIADNVVDEANLKVSNSPTNGQFLQAQSGNTGGLTWAEAGGLSSDAQFNTVGGINAGADFSGTAEKNTLFGGYAGTDITDGDRNSILGYQAGYKITTSSENTLVGFVSGYELTSGTYNNLFGSYSGLNLTTGSNNTGIGYQTLGGANGFAGTQLTGDDNVAVGNKALKSIQFGANNNTCIGVNAGASLTTGQTNTFIGANAGNTGSTTCTNTVAIGEGAKVRNGNGNIAIGWNADCGAGTTNTCTIGGSNITKFRIPGANINFVLKAYQNPTDGKVLTADANGEAGWETPNETPFYYNWSRSSIYSPGFGGNTYPSVTSPGYQSSGGYNNLIMGRLTGNALTSGGSNVLIGNQAGQNQITDAEHNTGVGLYAIQNLSGDGNTALGYNALAGGYNSGNGGTGYHNTGVGHHAGYAMTNGYHNTMVGKQAGSQITTAYNNLCLGYLSGTSSSPSGALQWNSNTICLGDNAISNFYCADTSISSSDKRDKTDITDFTHGLKWVEQLKPITYRWDKRAWYNEYNEDGTVKTEVTPDGSKKTARQHIGFLAQDVLAVEQADGFASKKDDMLVVNLNEDDTAYGLKYERLVPVLVNAIKELSAKVKALEAK